MQEMELSTIYTMTQQAPSSVEGSQIIKGLEHIRKELNVKVVWHIVETKGTSGTHMVYGVAFKLSFLLLGFNSFHAQSTNSTLS